jgi:hypothetical protein
MEDSAPTFKMVSDAFARSATLPSTLSASFGSSSSPSSSSGAFSCASSCSPASSTSHPLLTQLAQSPRPIADQFALNDPHFLWNRSLDAIVSSTDSEQPPFESSHFDLNQSAAPPAALPLTQLLPSSSSSPSSSFCSPPDYHYEYSHLYHPTHHLYRRHDLHLDQHHHHHLQTHVLQRPSKFDLHSSTRCSSRSSSRPQLFVKRRAANLRERRRMQSINDAFDVIHLSKPVLLALPTGS